MGDEIKKTGNEALKRWQEKMPKFFKRLMTLAISIIIIASAIHFGMPLLGAEHSEWWQEVYRYIIGVCIGVAMASKLTCDGGFREKSIDKLNKTILDKDDN